MVYTEFLLDEFLKAMDDIGRYGFKKHGEHSFQAHRKRGDRDREGLSRLSAAGFHHHAIEHLNAYLRGEPHDHFHSRRHQLAAAAFNVMMEFYFAGLEDERRQENVRDFQGGVRETN
jgi:hypothetical protein